MNDPVAARTGPARSGQATCRRRPGPAPATPSPSPPAWAGATASTARSAGFAQACADHNERDFEALGAAARSGRIHAESL